MEYQEIKTLEQRVDNILMNFPDTRNSDVRLTIELWKRFFSHFLVIGKDGRIYISMERLYDVPSQDSIGRVRQKIQNDKGLYPPTDWKIAKRRGMLEDEWRVALGYPTKLTSGTTKPSWAPPSQQEQGMLI